MAPLGLEQLQRVAEYELELARIALTHKRCPSSWKSLLHSAISPLPPAESSSRVEEAQAGDGERTVGITSGGGLENVSEHLSLVFDGFDAIKAFWRKARPPLPVYGALYADLAGDWARFVLDTRLTFCKTMAYGGEQLGIRLVEAADLSGATDKTLGLGATIINLALDLPEGMPETGSRGDTDRSDPCDDILQAWGIADTSLTQAVDGHGGASGGKAILLGPARLVNHSCRPNLSLSRPEPRSPFSDWCATMQLQCRSNKILPGGSELFWTYGDGYFGAACKCLPCTAQSSAAHGRNKRSSREASCASRRSERNSRRAGERSGREDTCEMQETWSGTRANDVIHVS